MRRSAALRGILRRFCPRLFISIFRRRQLDTRAPSLGQSDRDRLLGGARTVLSFPNVVDFFAHEFPGLRTGGFPLARVLSGTLDRFLFRHYCSLLIIREIRIRRPPATTPIAKVRTNAMRTVIVERRVNMGTYRRNAPTLASKRRQGRLNTRIAVLIVIGHPPYGLS
jgi:hypothetical protein